MRNVLIQKMFMVLKYNDVYKCKIAKNDEITIYISDEYLFGKMELESKVQQGGGNGAAGPMM